MATSSTDNLVQATTFDVRRINYNLDNSGSNDFNQGDMLYMDTSAHLVKALDTDGHAATFCGVALRSSSLSLFVNQNLGSATKSYDAQALVGANGKYAFKTTAGETYRDDTVLYIGADAQTVTTVAGSNSIGTSKMRPGNTSLTGASGVLVDVLINVQFPVKSL